MSLPLHARVASARLAALALAIASSVVPFSHRTLGAQAPRPTSSPYFTPEDALDVSTNSVADLSDDGRWLVVTGTTRRDTFGQDFRRDGDPTYARGIPTKVLVIDTRSGATQSVFTEKTAVRALRWAPDGRRLGMLVFNGDVYEPAIWDRVTNKMTLDHLPPSKYVAETRAGASAGQPGHVPAAIRR